MSESTAATAIGRVTTAMVQLADQDKAIESYTEKLGFEMVADIPFGDGRPRRPARARRRRRSLLRASR